MWFLHPTNHLTNAVHRWDLLECYTSLSCASFSFKTDIIIIKFNKKKEQANM